MVVGHVAPEAAVGGNLALVRDGDLITIDADEKSLNVHLSAEELSVRRAIWTPPKPWYSNGGIAKYAILFHRAASAPLRTGFKN